MPTLFDHNHFENQLFEKIIIEYKNIFKNQYLFPFILNLKTNIFSKIISYY